MQERQTFEKESETNQLIIQLNDNRSSLFQIIAAIAISSQIIVGGFIGCCGATLNRRRIMTCVSIESFTCKYNLLFLMI